MRVFSYGLGFSLALGFGVGLGGGCAASATKDNSAGVGGAGASGPGGTGAGTTGSATANGGATLTGSGGSTGSVLPDGGLPDGLAACTTFTAQAQQAPAAMLIVLQRSASMSNTGKWSASQTAIVGAIDEDVFDTMSLGADCVPQSRTSAPPACLCPGLFGQRILQWLSSRRASPVGTHQRDSAPGPDRGRGHAQVQRVQRSPPRHRPVAER